MASPYFLGCDLSLATYTWSAGAHASYPVTNLATYFASDVSKSNATTADQYITIDFGSATACNTIALGNTNFSTVAPDTKIALQYNTNDDTTWADAVEAVEIAISNSDQVLTFSSQTKRYWRIIFTSTVPLAVAPQIGNLFLGTRLQFESTYEWDFARNNLAFETVETTSISGALRMSQTFTGRKRFDLVFRLQSDTFKSSFDTFNGTVRGKLRPFYFVDTNSSIYYVHLDTDTPTPKGYRYNQNNFNISLKTQLTA